MFFKKKSKDVIHAATCSDILFPSDPYCDDEGKPSLIAAKEISGKYLQIGKCCFLISQTSKRDENSSFQAAPHRGGWRMLSWDIEEAGIDVGLVYTYIRKLAKDRKELLECDLDSIEIKQTGE